MPGLRSAAPSRTGSSALAKRQVQLTGPRHPLLPSLRHRQAHRLVKAASGTQSDSKTETVRDRKEKKEPSGPTPEDRRQAHSARVLAGHAAYTGLVGSMAVVGGNLLHLDLFSMFDFSNSPQLLLGLMLIMPLQILNLIILGPDWSDWSLAETPFKSAAAQTQTETPETQQPDAAAAQPTNPVRMVSASLWGTQEPATPSTTTTPKESQADKLKALRQALYISQTNYVAQNPTANVPVAAEAGVAVIDALANELLLRGLVLGAAACWTRDRLSEAGWGDFVALPESVTQAWEGLGAAVASMAVQPGVQDVMSTGTTLDDASRWVTLAALTAGLTLLSTRRVRRSARQAAMLREISVRIKASRELQEQRRAKRAALQARKAAAATTSTTAAASSQPEQPASPAGPSVSGRQLVMDDEMLLPGGAPSGSVRPAGYSEPMVLATTVQASRDWLQSTSLGLAFVATGGNLAAPFVASVVNQLVFSALQRVGTERLRKRSAAVSVKLQEEAARLRTRAAERAQAAAAELAAASAATAATAAEQPAAAAAPSAVAVTEAPVSTVTEPQVQAPVIEPAVPATAVQRTLSLLDSLVPEPAAAAKP